MLLESLVKATVELQGFRVVTVTGDAVGIPLRATKSLGMRRMRDKPRCLLGFFVAPMADGGSRLLVGVSPPFGDVRGGVDGV